MIKALTSNSTPSRHKGKTFRVPLILAGWMIIANCSTLPVEKPSSSSDLDSSYAVKSVKLKKAATQTVSKDPRAYYHFLLALRAESESQFELAASHYREVVKNDPDAEEMHETLATLLLRSGQWDELLKVCRSSLEQFPDNPAINMIMADVLAARKDHYGAIKHYRKVTEADPGGSRAYLLMGTVYDALKQYDQAREMYQQVALAEPSNPLGHHFLSQAQIRQGELEAAEVSLGKAVSLRPNFIQAREHLAWVLLKLGKTEPATRELKLLIKLDPRNKKVRGYLENLKEGSSSSQISSIQSEKVPEDLKVPIDIHMNIAAIFYEQAIYLKALDEFQLALINEDRKEPHMLMSRIYEILGRLDKAIEEFEKLRTMDAESVDIIRYTARLYSLNKQPGEAVRLMEKAVALQPENDSLYHSLSLAYMAEEKYDLAIESMRTAITLNDTKDSYYFELGALLERSGKYSDAIENMQRAIEINPMHSNAHNFIGYMYAQEGRDLDKALAHLKKALSIQPRNGYFLDSLGWIYFKQGDSEKALTEIKKAMVYTSPDPVLYDHLGDVLFALKNYEEAHGAWKTSLSLTRVKMDDPDGGEMPDEKTLAEKINKVDRLLRESY
ncbi:MAG: hypothetical protein NPINA01_16740 [Nitrospinaceae bacterium]|nr:MAG: hypothetical protein NPINA01_16740 [Nitrospinaceae bacterium]